jgi:Domain of unknown function (DUF3387)
LRPVSKSKRTMAKSGQVTFSALSFMFSLRQDGQPTPFLDWTQRETVRADMRRTVRRLLAKYGYPPDAQEAATQLVIRQAELMAKAPLLANRWHQAVSISSLGHPSQSSNPGS